MPIYEFDPDNIKKDDMIKLADAIDEYISLLTEVMVIPDDIERKYGDRIEESIAISKKLIKKLRKGDKSVFKDEDEWNPLT